MSSELKPRILYHLQIIHNGFFENGKGYFGPVISAVYAGSEPKEYLSETPYRKVIIFEDPEDGMITKGSFNKYTLKGSRLFISKHNLSLSAIVNDDEEQLAKRVLKEVLENREKNIELFN